MDKNREKLAKITRFLQNKIEGTPQGNFLKKTSSRNLLKEPPQGTSSRILLE
jgi:hypothetical protein